MRFRNVGRRQLLKHLAIGAGVTGVESRHWRAFEGLDGDQGGQPLDEAVAPASTRELEALREGSLVGVSDRAALASFRGQGKFAYLLEQGREGMFGWSDENLAAEVSRDRLEGIFVPPAGDPTGASGAWVRLAYGTGALQLVWFGARFDLSEVRDVNDATDDTEAWRAALAYLRAVGGGTLALPPGASRVTDVIDIPCDVPVRIVGTGQRKNYPETLTVGSKQPSTVVPCHSGRAAFRFLPKSDGQGGFVGENFSVATLLSIADQAQGDNVPACAFGWDVGGGFYYGATFRNMSIHCFRKNGAGSAFDVYNSGGPMTANGAILVQDCHINFNNWIWRNLDGTHTNGLRFILNKAGKNGRRLGGGGIDVRGSNVCINDNIIEGTFDTISVRGPYAGVEIKGNYFEFNTGTAIISVRESYNVRIGPNNYTTMDYGSLDHKVLLYVVQNVECLDPYWPRLTIKANASVIGNRERNELERKAALGTWARADGFDSSLWADRPDFASIHQQAATVGNVREVDPRSEAPFQAESYTSTGSGVINYATSGVIGAGTGDWLCVSWLLKRTSESDLSPFVRLINSGGQAAEFNFYTYSGWFRPGEWGLITVGMRLASGVTGSVSAQCFPYGIDPPAGLISRHNWPSFYTVDDVNKIKPFLPLRS